MTDSTLPPISKARQQAYTADVRAFVKERRKAARDSRRLAWGVAGVLLLANVAQAWTQVAMLPLHKVVPLIFVQRADGTFDYYTSHHDLPRSERAKSILAAVWAYTSLREKYDYRDAQNNWDRVSAMSAPSVRDAYQNFVLNDPSSPLKVIGNKGQISVSPIGVPQLIRPAELSLYGQNTFLVRFKRTVQVDGDNPVTTTWTATVIEDTVKSLPARAWLNDPGGIIVYRYSSQQDTPR